MSQARTPRAQAQNTDLGGPTTAPRRAVRSTAHPGQLLFIGFALIAFFALMTTLQIQTNEAFVSHVHPTNILQPQWSIWLQLPKLILGDNIPGPALTDADTIMIIVGWGVEILFLALLTAYEVAIHSSQRFGSLIAGGFRVLSFFIVGFDFWSDANYGNVDFGSHLLFATIAAVTVAMGLTWGIALIERAWRSM